MATPTTSTAPASFDRIMTAIPQTRLQCTTSSAAPESSGAPIPEIAGPRDESLVVVARLLAARLGDPVRIEGASNPADPDNGLYETGALLPGPDAVLAGPTPGSGSWRAWTTSPSRPAEPGSV